MIDRIAAEDLDALALHDFCNRGAELHGCLSLAEVGWSDRFAVVGTGFCRPVKRGRRPSVEVLICIGRLEPAAPHRFGSNCVAKTSQPPPKCMRFIVALLPADRFGFTP
jgi:hypothetical protein